MICRIVQRLAFVAAAIVPFGLATVLSALVFFGGAGQFVGHDLPFYGLPQIGEHLASGCVSFALLCLAFVGLAVAARRTHGSSPLWLALALAIAAVVARLALVGLFWQDAAPPVDNGFAWLRAIGEPSPEDYHRTIPIWMNYSLLLRPLAFFFGRSYGVDLVAGALFNGLSAFLVFLVAERMSGRRDVPVLAVALYALNPAFVAYSLCGTPEHVAIAAFLGSAYLFCRMVEAGSVRRTLLFAFLCGLAMGVGNAVKPLFPLLGTAMVLAVLPWTPRRGTRVFVALGGLAVVFAVQFCVVRTTTAVTEKTFDCRLSDKQSVSHMLVVGLNRQGEGQLLGELSRIVQNGLKAGLPMEEAARIGRERVLEDWRGHYGAIPGFFLRKSIWGWQDFNTPFFYFRRYNVPPGGSEEGQRVGLAGRLRRLAWWALTGPLPVANAFLYFGVVLLGAGAMASCAFDGKEKGVLDVFGCMLIIGFFFMIMLIEAQSRYKCLILPFVFVFVARFAVELSERVLKGRGGGADAC